MPMDIAHWQHDHWQGALAQAVEAPSALDGMAWPSADASAERRQSSFAFERFCNSYGCNEPAPGGGAGGWWRGFYEISAKGNCRGLAHADHAAHYRSVPACSQVFSLIE